MDGWMLPVKVPSVSACVCEWVNPSDGRVGTLRHQRLRWSTLSGQKTRKAIRKHSPFAICNLSCRCLLYPSPSAMLTSCFSWLMLITVLSNASHGLPPLHVTMPLDCQLPPPESHWCGTLDRTAAAGHLVVLLLGSSREVLGKKKKQKKNETWTHSSSRFAWASVQQVASMLAGKILDVFSLFFFKGPSKCFLNFNHMRFETCILQEDPLLCLNFYNKTTGLI